MKKLVILFLLVSSLIIAQEQTHTVKVDDTLWDIAQMYYQNPFLWPYIWRANLSKIQDPHWIYPDQVFVIPPSPEAVAAAPDTTTPTYVPPVTPVVTAPVKKTAEVVSVVAAEQHIFTEEILHRAGFLVMEEMPYWARVLQTEPAGYPNSITTFTKIYIDRSQDIKVGDLLTIYRTGKKYEDPASGRYLGLHIVVLGKAQVTEIAEGGARCKVVASYDIIRNGDLVMPYEPLVAPEKVQLVPASKELEGNIVDIIGQEASVTPPHVFAVLNHGEEDGVVVGDVFDVYQTRNINDKEMPDFSIAQVQVMSVFQNASIGLLKWVRETVKVKRGEKCRLAQEAR